MGGVGGVGAGGSGNGFWAKKWNLAVPPLYIMAYNFDRIFGSSGSISNCLRSFCCHNAPKFPADSEFSLFSFCMRWPAFRILTFVAFDSMEVFRSDLFVVAWIVFAYVKGTVEFLLKACMINN